MRFNIYNFTSQMFSSMGAFHAHLKQNLNREIFDFKWNHKTVFCRPFLATQEVIICRVHCVS